MQRRLIALATATVILSATGSMSMASSRIAVNPDLVNPTIISSSFISGGIAPMPGNGGGVPTPPVDFWNSSSGYLPIFPTPPAEEPEIVMADVQNRMSILYVTDAGATAILGTSMGMRGLPWLFRQEPSNSGGTAALGDDEAKRMGSQRMWKVSGSALARTPSAAAMAAMLRAAVDRNCVTPAGVNTCGAHLVGVDEIGSAFGTAPGEPDSGTPGELLREAMISLAKKEFKPGISYASRIHFYVAPGVITSISEGFGPRRTLGANGKEMRRNYSQAMSAMSRAGGVWLEMYHYPERGKPRRPFTSAEWRDVPTRFAAFLKERTTGKRNPLNYMHFVLTDTPGTPPPANEQCRLVPASGASSNSTDVNITINNINASINLLPPCPRTPPPACPVLRPASGSNSMSLDAGRRTTRPPSAGSAESIRRAADNALIATRVIRPVNLAVLAPDDSGMTCQWQRAQGGDVNTRILANGPAAFKVTGTEAEIFGQQFRQFFVVG